jgi:hypothetical protein
MHWIPPLGGVQRIGLILARLLPSEQHIINQKQFEAKAERGKLCSILKNYWED